MDDILQKLVAAFEKMAGSFQLLSRHLSQQVETLSSANAALEARLRELQEDHQHLLGSHRELSQTVAELNRRNQELLRGQEELRRQDHLKTDFVATISHELRTPLTALKGALSLLLEEELPGPRRELLEIAQQNADRMFRLVTNLMDLTRLEAGQLGLERRAVDLVELVKSAAGMLRQAAREKGLHIQLSYPEGMAPTWADEERLLSVLTNFLENAIKFSPPDGRIDVEVAVTPEGVQVVVADQGPGIPADELPKIFDRFYQVEVPQGRRVGSGLGLYISKAIVEEHGGRIWAESSERGSRFGFSLPRHEGV